MSRFILQILLGERPLLFFDDDENRRDFVYVDDINDFHLLCIHDERTNNRTFRLGSGTSTSIAQVLETVLSVTSSRIEPIMRERPDSPDFQPAETLADIDEALSLGWAPRTSIQEGIREMVGYLKRELAGESGAR
jgi:nucleoside-diphosphate-sugar epimerase